MSSIQLNQETQHTLDRSSQVLRNTLSTLEETKTIGAETNAALSEHGEVLRRAQERSDEIDVNINKSERLIRGMEGWWGRLKNWVTKDKSSVAYQPQLDENDAENKVLEKNGAVLHEDESWNPFKRFSTKPLDKEKFNETQQKQLEGDEQCLDLIQMSLSDLKNMANDMGNELDYQDKELKSLQMKTDRNNARIKKVNHKIWKLT